LRCLKDAYERQGVVWFPHTIITAESGFRTNKPINKLEDFKGMKIRISGKWQGEVLRRLGASPVMLSGGEVYQALEKGVIDGLEYGPPALDWTLNLHEVTKYWLTPAGLHQTQTPFGVLINKKAWEGLPDDLKKIVEYAAMADTMFITTKLEYENTHAVKKFLDKGIIITRLPDKDIERFQEIYNEVLIEACKKNALLAEILRSQVKYLKDFAVWREMTSPLSFGRNMKNLPELD